MRFSSSQRKVVLASSLGTVFEWYDFYLYGSLAAIIAKQFFTALDPTSGFIFALLAFAAGFIVRPFGALVFGRLGDLVGRKHTFLVTIVIMGASTFLVGVLPGYGSLGVLAPTLLIALRLLQGLAIGGEYGGAATFVAEHAPPDKRGAHTAWVQTTATLGLLLSLMVILGTRKVLGEEAFAAWGWRVPFLLSSGAAGPLRVDPHVDGGITAVQADEGGRPHFEGAAAGILRPVAESENRADRAVRPDGGAGGGVVHGAVLRAVLPDTGPEDRLRAGEPADRPGADHRHTVLYHIGALSDRVGRKPIILAGCLLAALTFFRCSRR